MCGDGEDRVDVEGEVRFSASYLRFCFRLWRHETREKLAWKFAWLLPRKVALLAFVRVCSASGDDPSAITYESAYKAWERGEGK